MADLSSLVVIAAFGRLFAGVAIVLIAWPWHPYGRRPRLLAAVVLGALTAVLAVVSLVLGVFGA
jgi:hypothetical protein